MSSGAKQIVWDYSDHAPAVGPSEFLCEYGADLLVYSSVGDTTVICPCCGGGLAGVELLPVDLAAEVDMCDDEGPDVQVYVISRLPAELRVR